MNAHSNIQAASSLSADASFDLHLRLLAEAIRQADYSGLPRVDHELYDTVDWRDAAEYALDSDDLSEFKDMIERERFYQDWMDLSERAQGGWAYCFDTYCDRRSGEEYRRASAAIAKARGLS